MFLSLRLSTKIIVGGAATVFFFIGVLFWAQTRLRLYAYEMKEEKIRQLVETSWHVLDYFGKQEQSGIMTGEQARKSALLTLRDMRYGANDYFWVNDMGPRMIMHPIKSALDGKDLSDFADPNGLRLFVKMVEVCRARGEGLVRYQWPKPGSSKPVAKFSYVKLYAPWGWVVGSGIYVDDVEAQLSSIAKWLILVSAALALGSLGGFHRLAQSISRPLRAIAADLLNSTEQIAQVIGLVARTSQSVSAGSAQQASSVAETELALKELGKSIQDSTTGAVEIDELVREVTGIMEVSRRAMGELACAIVGISDSSRKVSNVLGSIESIAFQTNLLALNAAVEAARAGQAGVGFAVVADEVRGLAGKVSQAAKETGEIIGDSQQRAGQGAKLSEEFARRFEEIFAKTAQVSERVRAMREQSRPQGDRIHEITKAMQSITGISMTNAQNSENAERAAGALRTGAEKLTHVLDPLVEFVEGKRAR